MCYILHDLNPYFSLFLLDNRMMKLKNNVPISNYLVTTTKYPDRKYWFDNYSFSALKIVKISTPHGLDYQLRLFKPPKIWLE